MIHATIQLLWFHRTGMWRQQVDIWGYPAPAESSHHTHSQEWTAADTATLNIASLHYITAACAAAHLVYDIIIWILMILSLYSNIHEWSSQFPTCHCCPTTAACAASCSAWRVSPLTDYGGHSEHTAPRLAAAPGLVLCCNIYTTHAPARVGTRWRPALLTVVGWCSG